MGPKRGMSIEEKQVKLLAWFQASHTMYNIKEVETIASKKTGISSMQIKDVLKMLIDDGLVNCEKCGISNIYWSFQYNAIMKLNGDYQRALSSREEKLRAIDEGKRLVVSLQDERKLSNEEREKAMLETAELEHSINDLQSKYTSLMSNTPEMIAQRKQDLTRIQARVDVITDNIEILVDFIAKNNPSGLSHEDVRQHFNIPEDI